jgi:hypothetical protein
LPTAHRGPRLTGKRAGEARLQLLERGFVLVRTPWFFDTRVLERLRRPRTVLPFDSDRWRKFPELACYGCWVEQFLQMALPDEPLSLVKLDVRHEPAGSVDQVVDRMHIDGSYIRSVCTLYGAPTLYRDGEVDRPVPERQTLVMTAVERTRALGIPATLHRRPSAGPERLVIVCSFEPCTEGPQPEPIFQRVARTARAA